MVRKAYSPEGPKYYLPHLYSQPLGTRMTHMTSVANGNSLLTFTPFNQPDRGLSTVARLIYNSREEHSDSPAGNNWVALHLRPEPLRRPAGHPPRALIRRPTPCRELDLHLAEN